jgi:protocatechuate 3,4-dioxygenase beta subunit
MTRHLLAPLFAGALAVLVAACGGAPSTASPTAVSGSSSDPTPAAATASTATAASDATCTSPATPTIAETEGPYYRAGAPESSDLVTAGMTGTRLTLTGLVVTAGCARIAGGKVEIWQADANGVYDNAGYTLRGYVMTDDQGRFTIQTVVPGEYPGRTEHIHVKVTPPGGATLTTQLYFPGTAANDADGIYDPGLLLDIAGSGDALVGSYTFVVG